MLIYDKDDFDIEGPCVIALGTFDGVHIGHRKLIEKTAELARENGWKSVVYTFDVNPLEVIRPDKAPEPICTLLEKLQKIASMRIDVCRVRRFTPEFGTLSPETFIDRLCSAADVRAFVVGYNYTFGRGGIGNAEAIKRLASERNIDVYTIDPVMLDGEIVSSTAIRRLIKDGDTEKAKKMLGFNL